MSDYTSVAPPSNLSGGYDPTSAFADALQRARQIAAKINTPIPEPVSAGVKRPLEESLERETKKIAAINDPFGAQLAAMQQQQSRLGGFAPQQGGGGGGGASITEDYSVPDKMVGLIIGRGGEQISRLQAESGCKIQMAPESTGMIDRPCSLTGTRGAIEKAKDLISQIVNRGGPPIPVESNILPDGHTTLEMVVPGSKVGLIIGKGGETIKSLQERAGVKMVMIQDGPLASSNEKPLKITGEPMKCEYAKQLVIDLLTEKELEVTQTLNRGGLPIGGGDRGGGGGGGGGGFGGRGGGEGRGGGQNNEYGTMQNVTETIMVPRAAVGVVIGKGGEMIKKIQTDSGARVQFQQADSRGGEEAPERTCQVTGTPEQVQKGTEIIQNLINSIIARDQQNMGRGRGRGRGGFEDRRTGGGGMREFGGPGGGGAAGMDGRGPPGRGPPVMDKQEIQYGVPANKCGVIIGKGGENIRAIIQQTGAHVELSRNPPPNPSEKIFTIRGTAQQIEHAKHLINERIGLPPPSPGAFGGSAPSGGPGTPGFPQPSQGAPPGPGYSPQGWSNNYGQQWNNQGAPAPNDPAKAVVDANAQAWAAYYAQQYNAYGGQPQGQAPAGAQPAQPQPATAAAAAAAANAPTAAATPGQDYSAAWIEYYRSMGMFREAEMIEQQTRGQGPQGAPAQQPQQNSGQYTQPAAAAPQPAAGASIPPGNAAAPGSGVGQPPAQGGGQPAPGQPFPGYGQYYGQNYTAYGYPYQQAGQQYTQPSQ